MTMHATLSISAYGYLTEVTLYEYEWEGLLAALRRDRQHEAYCRDCRPPHEVAEDEIVHGLNARMDVRLLEMLNPKHTAQKHMCCGAAIQVIKPPEPPLSATG